MRGAVIPTSVFKGFLRACTLGSVAYSSTLEPKCRRYYFDNQTYNNGNYMN